MSAPFLAVVVCWLLAPLGALADARSTNRTAWSVFTFLGAASLLALALTGGAATFTLPPPLAFGAIPAAFRIDPLASWFLGVIGAVSLAVSLYVSGYMAHLRKDVDMRLFWVALHLLLLSMAAVVLAANAVTFLVAWEVMSLSSFLLVATDHRPNKTRQAALVYLGATRAGTALLAGGFLWIHAQTASWTFTDWHLQGAAAVGPGLLLLCGLGVKAGMWPFHLWLPIAHPAAPAPVSALMSGVMVKVAVYVMARLFLVDAAVVHPALSWILLGLGAVSAFWGVAFALLQHDLKRLLAYHTVENVGLILLGLGGAMVAHAAGLGTAARLAFASALFHTLNHAIFKSLLFLGAGAIDGGAGTRDLERLGGLGRRMPSTFAWFLLGSAAICALPPLNGFASEWLLYQSALHVAAGGAAPAARFMALLGMGWVALIGAMALACFTKACGVTFLGLPRSREAEHAHEATPAMRLAQGILGVACVVLGIGAPAVLQVLAPLTTFLEPAGVPLADFWTIPTAALLAILAATIAVGALWLRSAPVRTYVTWECGFGPLNARMQVTATSFVQPIARIFGALFRYAIHLRVEGANRRLFPEAIEVEPRTEAVLETSLYGPLLRWIGRVGDVVVRLQAGSIHLYLLTMFLTLMLLLYLGGGHF